MHDKTVPDAVLATFDRLKRAAASLPEVEEGMSYGTPALKLRKKLLCRVKDADIVVLMCPLEEKELLMGAAPGIYYQTDHYKGWPAVLVRMSAISDAELANRLALAWRSQAPKKLAAAFGERVGDGNEGTEKPVESN